MKLSTYFTITFWCSAFCALMHGLLSANTVTRGILDGCYRSILIYLLLDLIAYFFALIRRQRVRASNSPDSRR